MPPQPISPALFTSTSGEVAVTSSNQVFNPIVLHKIELPDGRTYTFTYNVWGEIDKVVYPTGAYERYRYDMIQGISASLYEDDVYRHANRGVVERWVSETGDGTDEAQHHWQYSAGKSSESAPYTVVITAPDGSRTERLLLGPQGDARFGFEHVLNGKAYEERVYSSSGQMLRRELTEWTKSGPLAGGEWSATRDARVTKQIEIQLDTTGQALSAATTFEYDVDINIIATKRYGYVSVAQSSAQTQAIGSFSLGTLLRTEETTFLVNDPNIGATTRDAYRARNLLSLPTSTRVKDGAGNIVAQTAVSYDEAAYSPLTYPSVTSWTDPQTSVRGLATTTSSWLNTTNTWLSLHAQYDQCGNLRKTWDAKGNLSQVEYSATYQYAYPTHTISADPDGAGPLTALTSDTVYDPTSGEVISQTDANNQTITTEFAATDALNSPNTLRRITKVNFPGGGWTAYAYGDQPGNLFVMKRTALDTTRYTEARQYKDRMGREVRSEMSEGSASILTDMQYDQMGRAWRTSNPYRIGEAVSWTTTAFDGLGRALTVTTPDGAVVSMAYNGNQVTVQDQAGKQKSSTTDALGRLTQVIEDPAGLAYQTTYTYDVVGNLRQVQQGTQPARYFMYDSLSRLIRARNPEQDAYSSLALSDPITGNNQWSLGYSYDANGNLLSRTDARGVTATFVYDALNRNTSINYSDSTPTITRVYDGAINGKGRLWASYAGSVSHTAMDSYDAQGRPLIQRQHFYANGSWGTAYTTQRTYNLAGGVSSQTYPSGKTVSYAYDQAGRTSAFTGNLGDGVTRTYAGSISYDQWNGLAREQFGTDTPLYHKAQRNIRGQLFDTRLSSVNDTWDWNRGRLISYYSSNHIWGQSGTDNNGNVLFAENWIPPANATLDQVETLTEDYYSYDSLNRLSSASESRMSNPGTGWVWAQQFAQGYSYDRQGNRTINAAQTWGTGINSQQFTVDPDTNRLGVPTGLGGVMSYDFAGNLINDTYSGAGTRTYDAENRMVTATNNANQQSVYTYDADGRRVRRNSFNQETWQVYGMEGELLAEYAANAAPSSPQKEYGYRNGQLLVTAAAPQRTNVAAAANGASASASSTNVYNGNPFPASKAIDGDRRGLNYITGGVWQSSTATVPQWLEVDFQGSKTIDEIDLFTLQDSYANPSEPTETMQFVWYGLTAFEVQYWTGTSWATVTGGSVTGNYSVWKKLTFTAITTTKIRVLANASPDGWSRVAEVEAWGLNAAPRTNVALSSSGGTASASSTNVYNGNPFPASKAIDGDRRGLNYNTGGVWQSSSTSLPQWLQVDFQGSKTIDEIDLFTLQDSYANPSEPTETMQFVWYGTTSFEVQYWNGSSWATVSGGSVTGNYNVWRKFSFSPITTSKIRVLISASPDGWSRVAEIEAWQVSGGSNSSADISWILTDHLGTPRMIADRTGSLAGVSRHDYLPFGEELLAGTGGRITGQGYGVSDGIRQKFTGKERDAETGLDYFGARYISSTQGRFASPDPLLSSGTVESPQSWNRYTYALNNPLRYIDPLGLFEWDASAGGSDTTEQLEAKRDNKALTKRERKAAKRALKFRERFRAALATASNAASSNQLSQDQQQQVQESVDSYGDENVHNGVLVGVRDNVRGSQAITLLNDDDTVTVTFNVGLKDNNKLAVTLAHEGRHVGDDLAWAATHTVGGSTDLNHYAREQRAWNVSAYVAQGLNLKPYGPKGGGREYQVWNRGWKAAERDTLRSRGIERILRYSRLSANDTNTYSQEHQHRP
jgi:RHS repeat-associated protein